MKKILNYFLFLSFIIFQVKCQAYICNSNADKLKVGDKAYLCIHIVESKTKVVFPLEVDEYSVVTIKGIYNQISSNQTNINFLSQVQNTTSIYPSVSNYNYKLNLYLALL